MDVPTETPEREGFAESSSESNVTAHRSSPERLVFTEQGNTDGWIATDLAVSLER